MHNYVTLIGRLTNDIEKEGNNAYITLAVQRSYKNADGIYETDFVPVVLTGDIATSTVAYCKKGDLIGLKGRIQSTDNKLIIIAEKVSFLAAKKEAA